jgi:hypothetical protein
MDDPLKKVETKVEGKPKGTGGKADKHRQQLIIGGTFALVLIAYLTYKKMGKAGGQAATGSPPGVTTATNVPSGAAAPDTTVPFAAPTDTTGGGTIQTGSSTNAPGAPSATKAQGNQPTPAPSPIKAPQAQSVTPSPSPAGHPALVNPLAPKHPVGQEDSKVAGPSDYPPAPKAVEHPFIKTIPYSTAPPTPKKVP